VYFNSNGLNLDALNGDTGDACGVWEQTSMHDHQCANLNHSGAEGRIDPDTVCFIAWVELRSIPTILQRYQASLQGLPISALFAALSMLSVVISTLLT
jgi:hypothetical protein